MADKDKGKQPIIIKKVKKGGHGFHGGSWKVAYADFVTAMMAFFLLMWLINMTPEQKKKALAIYFRHFSVFTEGQTLLKGQIGAIQDSRVEMKTVRIDKPEKPGQDETAPMTEGTNPIEPEKAKEELQKKIEQELKESGLKDVKEQVVVEATDKGVRIEVVDKEGNPIFPSGSDNLTSTGKTIVKIVGEQLVKMNGQVTVEGHTDAAPFRGGQISNWELSTSRASAARRELESNGIDPRRIDKVVGYADKELLVKDKPYDPRNRRISFFILQPTIPSVPAVPKEEPKGITPIPELTHPEIPPAKPAPKPEVKAEIPAVVEKTEAKPDKGEEPAPPAPQKPAAKAGETEAKPFKLNIWRE